MPETIEQGGTGGQATGETSTSQQTGSTGQTGQQTGQTTGQQTSGQTTSTGTQSGFTYTEDRSKWIPPHRFNEVNTKAQRVSELEASIKERDAKIAALVGVTPPTPGSEKAAQVKDAFLQMFPQFKSLVGLTPEQIDRLTKLPEDVERVNGSAQREATRHGKAQLNALSTKLADAIGADKLSEDQTSDLRDQFTVWFRAKVQAELKASGGDESETLTKYEEGSEEILDAFVARYKKNWLEPARRVATAGQVQRTSQRVPNSGPRNSSRSMNVWTYAAKVAKERGLKFGNANA
jgi:hypothetical protein